MGELKEVLSKIMKYSYYNDKKENCVVLDIDILKKLYKAENIYFEEPKEDNH